MDLGEKFEFEMFDFKKFYSVFQGFRQAKSANGGSIFKLKPNFDTAPAASKNEA